MGRVEAWKAANLPRFPRGLYQGQRSGPIAHAYIYGCDENKRSYFPKSKARADSQGGVSRRAIMTTASTKLRMESAIKSVDAFCPLTPASIGEGGQGPRGRQTGLVVSAAPASSSANMFIECSAIGRPLAHGRDVREIRPDGFLYYQISIWNSQKPITSGPSPTGIRAVGHLPRRRFWTCVGA